MNATHHNTQETSLITRRPSLKFGWVSFSAKRHSWDADWSQTGNLQTLTGSRSVCRSRAWDVLAKYVSFQQCELTAKYEIMVWACQVGPLHLTLTRINLEVNWIAKNKCVKSQKLDTRRRGTWELERHITHSLPLIYSVLYKESVRKSYFHSETKSYSVECLCYCRTTTDRWFDHTKTW